MSFTLPWHLGHSHSASRAEAKHRRAEPQPLLERKERVLYRVDSATGISVATNQALIHSERTGSWRRIAWSDIASIGWSQVDNRFTLHLWPSESAALPPVRLVADARLAALARERVGAHLLLCVPVDLDGNTGTVIAVRDGEGVRWRVILKKPTDDPETRRACAEAIAEIRGLAGI